MDNLIFVLLGKSGAGKSSLAKAISKHLNIREIVSTTSRPKREGEVDGKDYYYKSYEEMEEIAINDGFVEYTCYNNWYYGVEKSEIDNISGNCIVVVEPNGYKQFKNTYGSRVIPIYIQTRDKERLLRSLHREENPNCKEICRRLLADTEDFKEVEEDKNIFNIDNNKGFVYAQQSLIDYINYKIEREN